MSSKQIAKTTQSVSMSSKLFNHAADFNFNCPQIHISMILIFQKDFMLEL